MKMINKEKNGKRKTTSFDKFDSSLTFVLIREVIVLLLFKQALSWLLVVMVVKSVATPLCYTFNMIILYRSRTRLHYFKLIFLFNLYLLMSEASVCLYGRVPKSMCQTYF